MGETAQLAACRNRHPQPASAATAPATARVTSVAEARARRLPGALLKSEGRLALVAVLQRTRGRFVAVRCRVAPSRVSEWASGRCAPSKPARALLLSNYGIPADSWDR